MAEEQTEVEEVGDPRLQVGEPSDSKHFPANDYYNIKDVMLAVRDWKLLCASPRQLAIPPLEASLGMV
jgi:hypothetical protein